MSKRLSHYKYNKLKRHVADRDNNCCVICGMEGTDIHHIVFRSQGGEDTEDNLVVLCRRHHTMAHGVHAKEVRDKLIKYIDKEANE